MTTNQPPDHVDLTIAITEKSPINSYSGNIDTKPVNGNVLPVGTRLEEFEIIDIIGWGGFGIVYLAYDHLLHRQVALKEYMPSTFASRSTDGQVIIKADNKNEIFSIGLKSFINEARLLAHYDHPSLIKVYRFWESNGTAYMVMPFYQGITLKDKINLSTELPDEKWLKNILSQLLDALHTLHQDTPQCLHRDISPENILILPEGRALLLDFGAARRVISDMTRSLTVILKPGYAPIEQYADETNLAQGPWTDIYSLAAVIYFTITRKSPIPSVNRLILDRQIPLSNLMLKQYSATFLKGIDNALTVKPENRPQNTDEFLKVLGISPQHPISQNASKSTTSSPKQRQTLGFVFLLASIIALTFMATSFVGMQKIEPEPKIEAQSFDAAGPVDPVHELEAIFNARDRDHAITISMNKPQVLINKDLLNFTIHSAKSGYVYILAVGTNQSDFLLLFPNAKDKNNYINANQLLELPRKEWKMIAAGPPGVNHFVAIVSNQPRSFSHANTRPLGIFEIFSLDQPRRLLQSNKEASPFFAGKATCDQGESTTPCLGIYGAALFSIEEIEI